MPAPISTRGLLSQNCSRWHLSPLLAVLNCIATSQSPNPQVQVDACLHRHACYCNPCRTRITATWQVNSRESSNQGAGKGTRAVGCCHGWGGGSAGAGAAAGAERNSQAAQMSPATGGRWLRGRNGASCLTCLALSDGKVPGIFGTLPPPQARPERGRRAQKSRRNLKITITFKGSCRARDACPKKTSIPLKKKKSILPQNHFVKIGSNGSPTPTDRSHGTHWEKHQHRWQGEWGKAPVGKNCSLASAAYPLLCMKCYLWY